jgi:haloalkane dehalogenase
MGTSQGKRYTRAVRAGYLKPYRSWHDRVAILRFVQDIPMNASHPTRKTVDEIENRLHLLSEKPMLIFWGEDDPVFTTGTFLSGWTDHFPEAEVHQLSNAGHFVVEDAHERILPRLTSFLAQQREAA